MHVHLCYLPNVSCFSFKTPAIQVERLLSSEQKATDYRSPEDGFAPDHRPTNACTRYSQQTIKACILWASANGVILIYIYIYISW